MGKSVKKGRVAKSNVKLGTGIHPKSRKAQRLGKQIMHEKRIEQSKIERRAKEQNVCAKLEWFQREVMSDDLSEKATLSRDDVKTLIQRYMEDLKVSLRQTQTENAAVPSKRVPNATQIKREQRLAQNIEMELQEASAIGMEIPDLSSVENLQRLKEWNGHWKKLPSIRLVRFKLTA